MKILILNLPWQVNGRKGVRAGSRWPHLKIPQEEGYLPFPFFLGYATSLLKKNKFDVKAIDAIAEDMGYDTFLEKVRQYKPDMVFSEVSTPSLKNDLEILRKIKEENNCKIAIAGPDMNIFDETFMKKNEFIDFIIIGEYEFTLLVLVQRLKIKKETKDILGLISRTKSKIHFNEKRVLDKDINRLPWPDRDDFPIYNYHDCPGGIPSPSAQMIASRGCPFSCTFCAWPQLVYGGRNYRARDIKDVVDEMEYLVKIKGFKSIYFDDDTFNIGKERMLKLVEELKQRDWKTPWAFMGRADLVDEEILLRFKEVGLAAVKYGVESGVQEIVDSAEKKLDLKLATKNMLLTKKYGIKMHLTFTFGLPGETKETIKKTLDYVLFIDPESVQFSILTPFPGTRFYDYLKERHMITSDKYENYDGNTKSVIRTETLSSEELTKAQRYAYRRWEEHKIKKYRYKKNPINLFFDCLKEHSLLYTLKHTNSFIMNRWFLGLSQKTKK